jgi:hypothetical protein
MTTVYVVRCDNNIERIFSNKEKAEECISSLKLDYGEKAVCIEYKVN